VREHNFQVDWLQAAHPEISGDQLYETARAIVGAEIAHITYAEFLPHLLGPGALAAYDGYDPTVDPRLSVEFAGAAYRWGHSTVSAETERKDEAGEVTGPALELRDAFFLPPAEFVVDGGAGGFLRHLATDLSQAMDARIVEDLRNFLFDPPVGLDLAAINIQRGRDLGLGTLNETRTALGLETYTEFGQITGDTATADALRAAFGTIEQIDLWTGGLSEDLAPGAFVGPTFAAILVGQFERLRDGDRLWYENGVFDEETLADIKGTSLSDLILRHTGTQYLQDHVFTFFERRDAETEAEHPEFSQLVVGTEDAQTLEGGEAGDMLAGGDGDQVLSGGPGGDTLLGGAGADVFRLDAAEDSLPEAPDVIRDFTQGEDRVDVSELAEKEFAWLDGGDFTASGAAEARTEQDGERTRLLLDVDGDGAADAAVEFQGVVSLTRADIVL
jgi:hypothetical protein